jgi:hypothetical protein
LKDFALISNSNNLLRDPFGFRFTESNQEYVDQKLRMKLKMFLGEWYLDINKGIPYYQEFLVKAPNKALINSTLKKAIIETEGIAELQTFEVTYEKNRTLNVYFVVVTDTGETVEGVV